MLSPDCRKHQEYPSQHNEKYEMKAGIHRPSMLQKHCRGVDGFQCSHGSVRRADFPPAGL